MSTDKDAEAFSEALFTYILYAENIISNCSITETKDVKFEFVAEAAKVVVVLSAFSDSSFNEIMDDYFKLHKIIRLGAFTLVSTICFDCHADNNDIFLVILTTLSFVYRLVAYLHNRGHVEYLDFGSMCWTEIFQCDLKEDFYSEGGWSKFKEYVSEYKFVPFDEDEEKEVFVEFMEEIDHLFPKMEATDESND